MSTTFCHLRHLVSSRSTRMKQVIHLLSCQARLPHRSNETHQALKRSQRQVGCMDKCTERVRRPERWRMRSSHSFSHWPDVSCDSGLSLQEHRSQILSSVRINKTNSNQTPYCCYFIIIKNISESLRTLSPSGPIFPGNPFLPILPWREDGERNVRYKIAQHTSEDTIIGIWNFLHDNPRFTRIFSNSFEKLKNPDAVSSERNQWPTTFHVCLLN